jgi:spore germination protein GerM
MTPRRANVLTAVGLLALLAVVALTAPRWSSLLREPLSVFEGEEGAQVEPDEPVAEGEPPVERRINVRLYFESPGSEGLLSEERTILFSDDLARQIRTLVEELVRGPTTDLQPTLPPETRVLEVFVSPDGVAYVNLSGEASALPGGSRSELHTVYSVVNSVTANFPAVRRVQILVEDRMADSLGGHVDLTRPLPPDMTLTFLPPPPDEETAAAEGTPGVTAQGSAPPGTGR